MAAKIFINYRRDDSIGMAGRLHDRLAQAFGPENIFMDVNIPVGEDFVAYLNSQVAKCDVVLAVIGPKWLRAKDKRGQRRLHQPDDWVAIELAAAFTREHRGELRIIPILVEGTGMPRESELPDSLKPLARRQAVEARHAHFEKDAEALVARMREAMAADSEKKVRLEAVAKRKEQKQPEATTLKNPENPAPRPVESVVVPPSPLPLAGISPPRDRDLRELISGLWYDRAENEYLISGRDGSQVHLRVRQTIKSKPDRPWDFPGSVEGEIVRFDCWLPKMGGFEGKLVRSANVYSLVGQYATFDGRWDVTLHRSPAPPPQPPQREVAAKIEPLDFTKLWRK